MPPVFDRSKLETLLQNPLIKISAVARQAGITMGALTQIRSGETKPRANTLAAIAAAFNKPMEYFFTDDYQNTDKEAS